MTETQGGLPRRSFIAAMAVAAVASGGIVLNSAPRAQAAAGHDAEWRISSEPADAKTG